MKIKTPQRLSVTDTDNVRLRERQIAKKVDQRARWGLFSSEVCLQPKIESCTSGTLSESGGVENEPGEAVFVAHG